MDGYFETADIILSIFDGPKEAFTVRLQEFGKLRVTFGRAPDNDIVLESRFISKYHGHFIFSGDCWKVEDWKQERNLSRRGSGQLDASV